MSTTGKAGDLDGVRQRVMPIPNRGEWPGLTVVPHSPIRAILAEALFRSIVRTLPIRVMHPDGRVWGSGDVDSPVMHLHRPKDFFHRLGADSTIGFGESYMVGDWSTNRLADLLTPFAERISTFVPSRLQVFRHFTDKFPPPEEENTVDGARQNIRRHYDLSNELFKTFLDDTMTYSSALFDDMDKDLTRGQLRKIDSVLDYADVTEGTRLLEIGTGWGALAIQAAQRGALVTTVTISSAQKSLAEERIAVAGVADRIKVLLCDYRAVTGQYDAIVSVETIEAVGEKYWPVYFRTLDRLLAPGGRVGLQAITMPHDRMQATRHTYSWINKYIFPGGLIPSVEAIERNLRTQTSLRIDVFRDFGQDYADTLQEWRRRFMDRWYTVRKLGFDEVFKRMWEFYLAYCEAGFRSGYLNVRQFSLVRH